MRGTSDTAPVMNPEPVSDGRATLLEWQLAGRSLAASSGMVRDGGKGVFALILTNYLTFT